jgi:hypothetical protein
MLSALSFIENHDTASEWEGDKAAMSFDGEDGGDIGFWKRGTHAASAATGSTAAAGARARSVTAATSHQPLLLMLSCWVGVRRRELVDDKRLEVKLCIL